MNASNDTSSTWLILRWTCLSGSLQLFSSQYWIRPNSTGINGDSMLTVRGSYFLHNMTMRKTNRNHERLTVSKCWGSCYSWLRKASLFPKSISTVCFYCTWSFWLIRCQSSLILKWVAYRLFISSLNGICSF